MKYYQTSDLGIAAYLVYKGLTLLGPVETEDPRRHALFFVDDDNREQYVKEFEDGTGEVYAKKYSACAHKVARELRNPLRKDEE